MSGQADGPVHRVTSAEEAVGLLDTYRPAGLTLAATLRPDRPILLHPPPDSGPVLTIVLDRLLTDCPSRDRVSRWNAAVRRILGHDGRLVWLTVRGIGLSPDVVAACVRRWSQLRTLVLDSCALDPLTVDVMATQVDRLTTLDLRGNRVGDQGARAIAGRLPRLTTLGLGSNAITSVGIEAIARRLSRLTTLDLSGNRLGFHETRVIAEHLGRLTALDLSHSPVGDTGVQAIADRLPYLTTLRLANAQVGSAGATAIADGLADLTTLDLSSNHIGPEGTRAIADSPCRLTTLILRDTSIGSSGVRQIARGLPDLTTLDLSGAEIGSAGASAIGREFHRLTALRLTNAGIDATAVREIVGGLREFTSLDLSGNEIGNAGADAIAAGCPRLTTLSLADCRISPAGATSIAELTGLATLDLSGNQVGNVGARAIAHNLRGLTSLDLSSNQIGPTGAEEIARHLSDLQVLYLAGNRIGPAGARAIAEHLGDLRVLHLGGNLIGDAGARALAAGLPLLGTLTAEHNDIGDVGVEALARHLPNLVRLNLGDNRVGDDGARALAGLLPQLVVLDISGNQVGEPGIRAMLDALVVRVPNRVRVLRLRGNQGVSALGLPELADLEDASAIGAIYRRLEHADDTDKVPFGEAKLVVLGNEAVGKTSLIRALVEGKRADPDEARTAGVNHRIWVTPWTPADEGTTQLNIWDFGGQEIMHQTHRYFLSERCIHLIVLDRRHQDDTSVHTWLQTVAHRAPHSPVVIVVNKCDDGTHNLDVDFERLRQDHPEIEGIFNASCAPSEVSLDDTLAPLRTCLQRLVTEDERLSSVRIRVPKAWVRVRDAVRTRAQQVQVLSAQQYVNLCQAGDDPAQRVTDPDEQNALLRLLHQIGVVVAHGLTSTTDTLTGLTLLDPNWFTTAVYTLLDYGSHEFDRHDLGTRLRKDPDRASLYPDDRLDYIVDLLQQPAFALAFRLPGNADPPRYLLPEALTPTAPTSISGWDAASLRFRYRYDRLPRGLIPQFQVLSHQHAGHHPERWRAGCTLVVHGCPVLIDGKPADNLVDILVAGPPQQRRDALAVVRDLFQQVHDRMPETVPAARVPLPDLPQVDVGYDHLRGLEARYGPDHKVDPEGATRSYRVGVLLSGVRDAREHFYDQVRPRHAERDTTVAIGQVDRGSVIQVGTASVGPVASPPAPELADPADSNLSRLADAGAVVSTLVGVPLGVGGAALYLLGQGDGWPVGTFLTGGAIGGMCGAIAGALLLGRRRSR